MKRFIYRANLKKRVDRGPTFGRAFKRGQISDCIPQAAIDIKNGRLIMTNPPQIEEAWGAVRAILHGRFFSDIKIIAGQAGLDVTRIAHIPQGAPKGELMTEIDTFLHDSDEDLRKRFITIVAEEVSKNSYARDTLRSKLSRLGWDWVDNTLVPIEILDPSELPEISKEAHDDLVMASRHLRDGDLSGAITAACGVVDSTTAIIYANEPELENHLTASFQERCSKALAARGVLPRLEDDLHELGWEDEDIKPFIANFKGALNQGAYVMQKLRSKMGDVHGTKPALKPLVFDSLKWAQLIVRSLNDE